MSSSVLSFLEDAPPNQVVRTAVKILHAYHEREAERLEEILNGYGELHLEKLENTWQGLLSESPTSLEALATLTKIIVANLDGGDCPISIRDSEQIAVK